MSCVDFVGKPITVGCVLAYPADHGKRMAWLRVTEILPNAINGLNPDGFKVQIKNWGRAAVIESGPTVEVPTVEVPTVEVPTVEVPTVEVPDTLTYHPDRKRECWSFLNDAGERVYANRDDSFNILRAWLDPAEALRTMESARFRAFGIAPPEPTPETVKVEADPVAQFISLHTHHVDGALMPFKDFYARFQAWLPVTERENWSRIKVSRSMPPIHAVGAGTDNARFVSNLSWEPGWHSTPYVVRDGKLRRS